jgi:NAD(P)-dependent dehydrogenase (short-subunit alcohol dehydrogenase family)
VAPEQPREVNLSFFLTKAASAHLQKSAGTIVNTASLTGHRVFRVLGGLAHATAKMGNGRVDQAIGDGGP